MTTPTRPATPDDVDAIVTTVAAAFTADPAWTFMLGADAEPDRLAFARALLLPRIPRGTAWVTDDCSAVAMWDRRPPGPSSGEEDGALWAAFRAQVGEAAWARIETYEAALNALAPARPHWYLGVLATHPDVHGRGLATAVMQPGFAAAAADGWDCWLETSTAGNKAFYERRGFTENRPVTIPGGPPTWWLRRPPA